MPSFSIIWDNHPNVKGEDPLLDRAVYENQCAINISAAFIRSGIDLRNFDGTRSWQRDKPRYPIRAEELANWLDRNQHVIGKPVKFTGDQVATAFDSIKGKTGVVFIKDYYGPGMSGDHIDVFNGSRFPDYFSWIRITTGFSIQGRWSDYREARAIWFWHIP